MGKVSPLYRRGRGFKYCKVRVQVVNRIRLGAIIKKVIIVIVDCLPAQVIRCPAWPAMHEPDKNYQIMKCGQGTVKTMSGKATLLISLHVHVYVRSVQEQPKTMLLNSDGISIRIKVNWNFFIQMNFFFRVFLSSSLDF